MQAQTVSIIGLGRAGVSVGLAVKAKLPVTVVGYDPNPDVARAAQTQMKAIDAAEINLYKAAAKADILVLMLPVAELEETLQAIGGDLQPHTLVLDFSGLKGPGLKWARKQLQQGHYVGATPVLAAKWLADGRTELTTATADLFQDSLFCLMPSPDADPQAVETAVNFGMVLGARPYFIDPMEYDALVQGTEALPGFVAAALFKSLKQSTSWQDMLRFAGSSFNLATLPLAQPKDIAYMALHEKEASLRWLEALITELTTLRRLVYESEPQLLTAVFEELAHERDRWLLKRQDNEWDERTMPDIERPSMMGHMLGGLAPDSRKKGGKR
ncbi:MAG TPA: prephenate dehydrogenase [Chloroflexota bacterium]|nr:prephenate dehydrogenase [Chloroflexota bacterium]